MIDGVVKLLNAINPPKQKIEVKPEAGQVPATSS